MEYYTENLGDFGYREFEMAAELLKNVDKNVVGSEGLKLAMNSSSGNVFLTDEDFRVWMMNGPKFEEFYHCPDCGCEGFLEEFADRTKEDCTYCVDLYKQAKEDES